jgi:hypothetical protein
MPQPPRPLRQQPLRRLQPRLRAARRARRRPAAPVHRPLADVRARLRPQGHLLQAPHPHRPPRRHPVALRQRRRPVVRVRLPHPAQPRPRRRRRPQAAPERPRPVVRVEPLLLARPLPELRRPSRRQASHPGRRLPLGPQRRAPSPARQPQPHRPTGRNTLRRRLRRPSAPRPRRPHPCHHRRVRHSVI